MGLKERKHQSFFIGDILFLELHANYSINTFVRLNVVVVVVFPINVHMMYCVAL